MVTVAIGTDLLLVGIGKDRRMLRRVDGLLRMTSHAGHDDPVSGVHDIRRSAVSAGGPGLIGDMRIAGTVTVGAPEVRPGVRLCDLFLRVIDVTHKAPAVVRDGALRRILAVGVVEQQGSLLVQEQGRFLFIEPFRFAPLRGRSVLRLHIDMGTRIGFKGPATAEP